MTFKLTGKSNWENIAFYLIEKYVESESNIVYRQDVFSDADLYFFSEQFAPLFLYKPKPKHPEETLQRTLQNLRDKGYLDFLRQGEYRLTKEGRSILRSDEYKNFCDIYQGIKKKLTSSD